MLSATVCSSEFEGENVLVKLLKEEVAYAQMLKWVEYIYSNCARGGAADMFVMAQISPQSIYSLCVLLLRSAIMSDCSRSA